MFANGKSLHRVRAGAVCAASVIALAACSTGNNTADESPTATATSEATASPTATPVSSPTGSPEACYFLVDENVSSDGDVHVGNFFAIADFPAQNAVLGQWWSPYGEDKGALVGTVADGKLTGEMAVEHTEGGTTETVPFSEAFSVAGGKATLAGYKAVTEAEFRTYVSGTGFLFSPCM